MISRSVCTKGDATTSTIVHESTIFTIIVDNCTLIIKKVDSCTIVLVVASPLVGTQFSQSRPSKNGRNLQRDNIGETQVKQRTP